MKLFKCHACQQILYFENTICVKSQHRLGFIPDKATLTALVADGDRWRTVAAAGGEYKFCANTEHGACNWLIEASSPESLCISCRHNRVIPDLTIASNLEHWQKIEIAKHRLFYSLLCLKLPTPTRGQEPVSGLAFDLLAEIPQSDGPRVMMGHDSGLITISLAEADDAYRERTRVTMREPYRTLLGHFRHEIGHYFWDRLVRDRDRLAEFRVVFGDEQQDYGQALQAYYSNGAPMDWQSRFVTMYATSHPWEDFAETWAHYLHIVDTLEMAHAFGLSTHPGLVSGEELDASIAFDAYRVRDVSSLIDAWLPLSLGLNSLNRAMGLSDLYPFVLSAPAIAKLGFVHDLLHAT